MKEPAPAGRPDREQKTLCYVCNLPIPEGQGRYLHGDWVLCTSCHDKHTGKRVRKHP